MRISRLTTAAVLVALTGMSSAWAQGTSGQSSGAMKMTQTQCESLWNRADSSKSGSLAPTQAKSYVTNFSSVDTDSDGKLSRSEFMSGCDKGLVQSSASTGGAAGAGQSGTGTGSGSGTKK